MKWQFIHMRIKLWSRRLHGRRGLKYGGFGHIGRAAAGRRLHGRRGLKSDSMLDAVIPTASPPSRAAWIEIGRGIVEWDAVEVAAFTGGVD